MKPSEQLAYANKNVKFKKKERKNADPRFRLPELESPSCVT
jgi:hypothetical protein